MCACLVVPVPAWWSRCCSLTGHSLGYLLFLPVLFLRVPCRYLTGHREERERGDKKQQEVVMYKLKDWPPSADIRERLCRHYAVSASRHHSLPWQTQLCFQYRALACSILALAIIME